MKVRTEAAHDAHGAPLSESATCSCAVEDRKIPAVLLDNLLRAVFRRPDRFLAKHLAAGRTAADLGSGSGFFTLPMAKIVGAAGRVYAIDFDPRAIQRLQRKTARRGVDSIVEARACSASEIDFVRNASVDFVLAEGLLCCMKDHDGVVSQIKRILKPAGRAYLGVIKFGPPADPRSVSKQEWERILGGFDLLDKGENALSRWALVATAR